MRTRICLFLIFSTFNVTFARDLKSPSSMLVGHWVEKKENEHSYFSSVDGKTGIGSFVLVQGKNRFNHKYRIVKDLPQENTILIEPLFETGAAKSIRPEVKYVFQAGGNSVSKITTLNVPGGTRDIVVKWDFVDGKVEP